MLIHEEILNSFQADEAITNYLCFLALSCSGPYHQRSPRDLKVERLLHFLAEVWSTGATVSVVQAMSEATSGSRSAVHKQLHRLRAWGFVAFEMDEQDNRVKWVVPTPEFWAYLDTMGKNVVKAITRPSCKWAKAGEEVQGPELPLNP